MTSMNDSSVPQSAPGGSEKPPAHHHGFGSRIRNYFLTGLVVAGPVAITIWLTWSFVNWVDNLVRPFIPVAYRPESYLPGRIPGTGLVIALSRSRCSVSSPRISSAARWSRPASASSTACRWCARSTRASSRCSRRCSRSPARASARSASSSFPRPACGRWCSCRSRRAPEITSVLPNKEEHVSVFMPCTPNPTTGFFFYVRAQRRDRARHPRRGRGEAHHVRRPDPAGHRRRPEAPRRARRSRRRRSGQLPKPARPCPAK